MLIIYLVSLCINIFALFVSPEYQLGDTSSKDYFVKSLLLGFIPIVNTIFALAFIINLFLMCK